MTSSVSDTMNLPTLYEYYTAGGIKTGLSDSQSYFTLNEREITIYSGAVHYFRVPREYWRDRLRKLRAAGLNAVETYVPWNLHEPHKGVYDFGSGETDFRDFLDLEMFLKVAQEEDLLAIVRPGPYICAEWEFGGLPSWLLRDPDMKLRTSDAKFVAHVNTYFDVLLGMLHKWQFTLGGPIVAFQLENEYGSVHTKNSKVDVEYLRLLQKMFTENGIVELLFTSDNPSTGTSGSLPDVLYTANFQTHARKELNILKKYRPGKPLMVMEYWTGWFDHWSERHHTRWCRSFTYVLKDILEFPASVNMYMFHGGTSWGFMNGANFEDSKTDNSNVQHDTSSYDYDAPLTEAGDYTDKYFSVQTLLKKHNTIHTRLPPLPQLRQKCAYGQIQVTHELRLNDLLKTLESSLNPKPIAMELLDVNNYNGQSYGYIIYRKTNVDIRRNSVLKIHGHVCDTVMVLINGELKSGILSKKSDFRRFGYWKLNNSSLHLGDRDYNDATLDLVVENWGRANFGKLDQFNQLKGIWQGDVSIDDDVLLGWEIFPLEFKTSWTKSLGNWQAVSGNNGPALYKAELVVRDPPKDTFVDMRRWVKGVVVVNGFVLARYCKLGPQQTCYLPAPLLKEGENDVLIFEHFKPSAAVRFSERPVYKTPCSVLS